MIIGGSKLRFHPVLIATAAVSTFFAAAATLAQDYPTKPIRLIVANSPGTPVDTVARIMAPEMSKLLGQPVIVENKPGAASVIGYEYVAKQVPADGYTIACVAVGGLAILPVTIKDLRFDPLRDLPPFIGIAEGGYNFGSSSKKSWKNLNELLVHAKANSGKLNYATTGVQVQLLMEAIIRGFGIKVTSVPYSAAGPYLQALRTGEADMGLVSDTALASLGDNFRVLAVTGAGRRSQFPEVPTFTELGFPRIPGTSYSFNAPVGVSKHALGRLHAAASGALQQPEVRSLFAKIKAEILNESPETAIKNLAEEGKLYADIAKQLGIHPQ